MYVYMYLWSGQWAVGIMGCRNNGSSELLYLEEMMWLRRLYASNSLSTELYNNLYVCSNPTQPVSVGLLLVMVLWYALISYRS